MASSSSASSLCSSSPPPCRRPFYDRFGDFPASIRDKLVASSMETMKQCLAKTARDIQGLSRITLGRKRGRTDAAEKFSRLKSELDAAEAAGVEVEEYRERLERLKGVADMYEEGLAYVDDVRDKKRRLMRQVVELQKEEVACHLQLQESQVWFRRWAQFSWKLEKQDDHQKYCHQEDELAVDDDHQEEEIQEAGEDQEVEEEEEIDEQEEDQEMDEEEISEEPNEDQEVEEEDEFQADDDGVEDQEEEEEEEEDQQVEEEKAFQEDDQGVDQEEEEEEEEEVESCDSVQLQGL